jgi:hypothetical protein
VVVVVVAVGERTAERARCQDKGGAQLRERRGHNTTHTRKSLRVKIFLKRASCTMRCGGMSLKPVSLQMRLPTL